VDKKIEIKQASADEELKMKALLEEFKWGGKRKWVNLKKGIR
jgi:hypothetical protein